MIDDESKRRENDPYAIARGEDGDVFGGLFAPGVGFFVEATAGGSSALLAGAFVRRFSGRVPIADILAAGQVFRVRPVISPGPDGRVSVEWRIRDDSGAPIDAITVSRHMKDPISPRDAERLALETAAAMAEDPEIQEALARAGAVAQIDRTPSPAPRPGDSEDAAAPPLKIDAGPPEAAAPPQPRPAER